MRPKPKSSEEEDEAFEPVPVNRTLSTEEGMRLRMGSPAVNPRRERPVESLRRVGTRSVRGESMSHPHIRKMVEAMGEGRQSGLVRMGTLAGSETATGDGTRMSRDTFVEVKNV